RARGIPPPGILHHAASSSSHCDRFCVHLMGNGRGYASAPLPVHAPLARRIAAVDHDGLDLARAVAAERRGAVVFGRGEAGDALLEGRELDHHEAVEFGRPFHYLIAAAAREHLAAELGDDGRHQVGVLLVFDRIVDLRPRNPIGRHGDVLARVVSCLSCPTPIKSGASSREPYSRRSQRESQASAFIAGQGVHGEVLSGQRARWFGRTRAIATIAYRSCDCICHASGRLTLPHAPPSIPARAKSGTAKARRNPARTAWIDAASSSAPLPQRSPSRRPSRKTWPIQPTRS